MSLINPAKQVRKFERVAAVLDKWIGDLLDGVWLLGHFEKQLNWLQELQRISEESPNEEMLTSQRIGFGGFKWTDGALTFDVESHLSWNEIECYALADGRWNLTEDWPKNTQRIFWQFTERGRIDWVRESKRFWVSF